MPQPSLSALGRAARPASRRGTRLGLGTSASGTMLPPAHRVRRTPCRSQRRHTHRRTSTQEARSNLMAKNLVIVESPAKAKTIEKYLGPDLKVLASSCPVRDLPRSDFAVDASGGSA